MTENYEFLKTRAMFSSLFFSSSGSIAAALFCFVPQMSFVSDFYGMNFAFVLQTETEGIFKKVARATLELPYCL